MNEGAPGFADYAAAQDYLRGLKNSGVRLGLERMQRLVDLLGHPERAMPCIHVAGTNGKGSVCAMLDAMLRAAGWRVGLYTSPHLVRLGERIQVDRRALPPEEITAYASELRPAAEQIAREAGARPSYFEFMTAMAFVHFARAQCDIAIIETGMGGRLDATNVVTPELSVITSIGLDHVEFLGPTLEAIAAEKAGIVKTGRPVIIGRLPAAAERVVREIAAARAAPVRAVAEEFPGDTALRSTNLAGEHQRANAATATLAARTLEPRWQVSADVIARGLRAVEWPGRWQRIRAGEKTILLDAAHNAEGAVALERELARLTADTGRAPLVVVGVLGRARAEPLLAAICRHAAELHLVVPRQSRACSHEELASLVPASFRGDVHRARVAELFPAPATCTIGDRATPVVVTGSIYLLGEVLAQLEPGRGPLEDTLQDF